MNALILFAKAPIKGEVKTRLVKDSPITEEENLKLYSAFLEDVASTAGRSSADRIMLNFTPKEAEAEMLLLAERNFGQIGFELQPQEGESFAERIKNSFSHTGSLGAKSMVMIGSDSPTLSERAINRAFELLEGGDVVLGPSGEGGIYLIGLKKGLKFDWENIFSEGSELSNFAGEVRKAGLALELLEEVTDVDVATDLITLISIVDAMRAGRRGPISGYPENTANMIDALKLRIIRNGGTRAKMLARDV